MITAGHGRQGYRTQRPAPQILLVDGFTAADWTIHRDNGSAILTVRLYDRPLSPDDVAAVTMEAQALLRFLDPGAEHREVLLLGRPPRAT